MTIAVKNSFSIEFSNWAELTINFVFTGKTFVVLKLKQTSARRNSNHKNMRGQGTTAETELLYPKNWGA